MKSKTRRAQEPHPAGLACVEPCVGLGAPEGGDSSALACEDSRQRSIASLRLTASKGLSAEAAPHLPYACLLSEQVTAGQLLMGARSVPVAWYCPSGVGM